MKAFICASWKKRDEVRMLAEALRTAGHDVFDFTDPSCRASPPAPPGEVEAFDARRHSYAEYIDRPGWRAAVFENRDAIRSSDVVILLLPCGLDATADWACGVGCGKTTYIVGRPEGGEFSPNHLWADGIFPDSEELLSFLGCQEG